MKGSCIVAPARDVIGAEVEGAFVIFDAELRASARRLEREYVKKYDHECTNEKRYAVRADGTICDDGLEPISPFLIAQYIEIERKHAEIFAEYIVHTLPTARIPVLYGPDSAIHVAEGMLEGLKRGGVKGSLFPVDRDEPIPQKAFDLALKTGYLLYGDSVINHGKVSASIFSSLPNASTASLIKVVTYFSHATALNMPNDGVLRDDRQSLEGFPGLREAIVALGHRHEFYVTDIGLTRADLFDRADAIAYAARSNFELLKYVRKFLKPVAHNAAELLKENYSEKTT